MFFAATFATAVAGCGSENLPFSTASRGAPATGSGSDDPGAFGFDGGTLKPPGCGVGPDGGVCDCIDTPLLVDPPNFYFVLDRSGSMAAGDKWNTMRAAVSDIMTAIGPRARFGATIYPGRSASCDTGIEVMSTRPGDSPSGTVGEANRFLLDATQKFPAFGGTPTAATLDSIVTKLQTLPGKTFVILATDGAPNCAQNTCGAAACLPNIEGTNGCTPTGPSCCDKEWGLCLDSEASISAVQKLKSAGIPTYVIGIPGSQAYGSVLDRMALAAGTAQTGSPAYYKVDVADKADLVSALRKVAAKIVATCTYELKEPPADVNRLNVYLDEKVVPRDGTNGWKVEGKTVTLLGNTCQSVMRGDVLDVRIILGCPTVEAR